MLATFLGSRGRRRNRTTKNSTITLETTSTIATHVFGVLGFGDAAPFPITNAAITPTTSVTPNAPRKNHRPVRIGRSPTTSASTDRNSVTGESIAASATSTSSVSTEVIRATLGDEQAATASQRDWFGGYRRHPRNRRWRAGE